MEVPTNLRLITDQLDTALSQFENNFPEEVGAYTHFLPLLHALVTYLNDTLTLALGNYNGINLPNYTKRGLVDGTGQLPHMLFGTAMNEDVMELREKFNHLTSFASAENKLIYLSSETSKDLNGKSKT